jgi:hypothetical protein
MVRPRLGFRWNFWKLAVCLHTVPTTLQIAQLWLQSSNEHLSQVSDHFAHLGLAPESLTSGSPTTEPIEHRTPYPRAHPYRRDGLPLHAQNKNCRGRSSVRCPALSYFSSRGGPPLQYYLTLKQDTRKLKNSQNLLPIDCSRPSTSRQIAALPTNVGLAASLKHR